MAITMLGAKTHRQPTKLLRKLREISAQKLCAGTVSFSIDTRRREGFIVNAKGSRCCGSAFFIASHKPYCNCPGSGLSTLMGI